MLCDIRDLVFPNYSSMQEVQTGFTDAINHRKMFYSSDFQEKEKERTRFTTVLSITSLQ